MRVRMLTFASVVPAAALFFLGLTPRLDVPDPFVGETGIEVTIREGTNMAAALSPDGRRSRSTLSGGSGHCPPGEETRPR